ncbi:MAG TPA: cupin domain-containing protein [Ignavibacteria bacterium]|nr:cupin domain-containing protein [Ignavibacteria bacterium]
MPSNSDNTLPEFKFNLNNQSVRELPYGWAKQATVIDFPVSKNIAGVLMYLKPGGLRELHWHANAAEWGYVISGNVRTTIVDPEGRFEYNEFKEGDIWYFPRGHGHSIEGLSPEGTTFMLVFDNGSFSEFATFSLTDWLSQTPKEIVAKNLGLSQEELNSLPDKEVYIVPASENIGDKSENSSPLTHKYELMSQSPTHDHDGGKLWISSSVEFPISETITGAILQLNPGSLRELHWHPNADEWIYILSGKIRLTVFASSAKSSVVELEKGEVGYTPMGYGHSIENIGEEVCKIIVVFNSGVYEEISLTSWLSSNPESIVSGNLNLPPEIVKKLPKKEKFIISGKK